MSAVAAVLLRHRAADSAIVARLLAQVPHRGERHEIRALGRCGVGVAYDPDHREAWVAARDGLVVALTGPLDNLADLRRRFGSGDRAQAAANPAEIVLDAFAAVDESLPALLRGNFACIVSDGARVWAFRDHIGFETLFYRAHTDGIYLATEAKQVLAGAGVAPTPDVELVEATFYGDVEDATASPLRGVTRLLAGTLLNSDGGAPALRRYWDPTPLLEAAKIPREEVAERFRELFAQAVARTVTGNDVVALSGGVDSPPIAAFGNREHLRRFEAPLPALAEVYPAQPSSDESSYIHLVADRLGVPLHTYEPGRQRLDRLQEWVRLFDGPWSTVSPEGTALRCREVRAQGFRTLLTGHFAEHVTAAGQMFVVPHLLWRGRLRAAADQLAWQKNATIGRRRRARQVVNAFTPRTVQRRQLFRKPQLPMPAWIDAARIANRDARAALPARKRWRSFQLPFFGGSTTGEADTYSHAVHGVRPRRPWADVDLWEFFLSLPAEVKFPDYRMKGFARTALRGDVPDEILDRRDKTNTNEYVRTMCLDYDALRRWLIAPEYRVSGVDYSLLAEELRRENMSLAHYMWAKDLAAVHAFMDLYG